MPWVDNMLKAEGLQKRLGTFQLGPVDLVVGNEVLFVLGENGAGKTTLLNLIAGIIKPDSGSLFLGGRKLDGLPIERRGIGYLFQEPYLFPHMNVYDNIVYGMKDARSSVVEKKIGSIISILNIGSLMAMKVQQLSGGEEQKVALARTLATEPKVLLMDEPLGPLDIKTKRRLRAEFSELFSEVMIPIIYVTHEPREALELADRVLVLDSGRVVEEGTKDEIFRNPKTEHTKSLLSESML